MNAVDAVKSGHLSIRKAAIEFDVPKTTLHDTGMQVGSQHSQ
jgi:hypothetical protein